MPIFNGVDNIANIYQGNNQILKVYQGANLKYELSLFGAYELIADINVATATTQIDFNNLNITKDDELRLVYTLKGDSSSSPSTVYIFANNDTTLTNYYSQGLFAGGSSVSAGRTNNSRIGIIFSIRKNAGFIDVKVSNNDRFVAQCQNNHAVGSEANSNDNYNFNIVNTSTVTSITKLSISATRTNGIAVGSRLQLYKVNTGVA